MKKTFLVLLVVVAIIAVPFVTFGAGDIIPCDGVNANNVADCNFDYLVTLGVNLMNYLILVSIPLAAIAFAYAGYLFLTAAGSESQISKAKEIFTKVLIGFIFVLGAWVIVSTITSTLLNPDNFYNLLR